ncbi:MAG TPA: hypothetical protein PKC48_04675 [Sphingorhabdus sp.]|jgi:hypothetical protein|uniref:hypothetical protein n=1 Tax=Sphingorhabdus sp. TaxID=1902408 RepID=UPI002BA62C83|nr:hypothetical protein [Sphingorhabdus sp.]HMT40190.1 hypothetical protein [Sphingorhabdus sp.]HMU21558.1 hypothetical protein [Sphingorhabdus sp.]
MAKQRISMLLCATAGVAALVYTIPVLGQQGPESLLPPGFNDPAPPPASRPSPPPGSNVPRPSDGAPTAPSAAPADDTATDATSSEDPEKDEEEEEEETEVRYDVPPTARRSLKAVGLFTDASGGFPAGAFGTIDGPFLTQVLQRTNGPLASRWGMIMTRRLLASRTETPRNVNGADWTAERSWLLLRMGDAVAARQLVQQIDPDRYTKRLYQVAMPVFLANADLSGMCPVADSGAQQTGEGTWKMAQPICASLAGEQGRATALINQARARGWMKGIDYLLGEKAVGAGMQGRRSVKIEWEKAKGFTTWRHGIGQATGVEPPEALYAEAGRQVNGWVAQLPTASLPARMRSAPAAAAMGVLSNRALVDIYSIAFEDPDAPSDIKARGELLRTAYAGNGNAAKVAAMADLWDGGSTPDQRRSALVLTARAAALIAPSEDHAGEADRLVASMLSAGFDEQAVRWASIVEGGSLGWGLLACAAPGWRGAINEGELNDFRSNDDSTDYRKSKFLLAGLAGLGRVEAAAVTDFSETLEVNIRKESGWSRAITSAAQRGESGTVVLLSAAALQGAGWEDIPPHHLFHIVRALKKVGLDGEARMIAAEAVSWS